MAVLASSCNNLSQIRTIVEGRIAYLNGVLGYEATGSLDPLFAVYLEDSVMERHRSMPEINTLYANICLAAHVYVGWYQYILTLLPQASTTHNFPENLYFMIARAMQHFQVQYDTNETEKKLENCDLSEKKHLKQIQDLLYNSCDPELFLWLNCGAVKNREICLRSFSRCGLLHAELTEKLNRAEISPQAAALIRPQFQAVESCSIDIFKQFYDDVITIVESKDTDRVKSMVQFYASQFQTLQTASTEVALGVFARTVKKIQGVFSMEMYRNSCKRDIVFHRYNSTCNGIKNRFERLMRQIEWEERCCKSLEEIAIREEQKCRNIKTHRDSDYVVFELGCTSDFTELQNRLLVGFLNQTSQEFSEEENVARALLEEAYENKIFQIRDDEARARSCLPWNAFYTREERELLDRRQEAPLEANRDLVADVRASESQNVYRETRLCTLIEEVCRGSTVPEISFLGALEGFGYLNQDHGGSECRWDIWDPTGKRHCAFFHKRHGGDMRITQTDWRFKNIVDALKRAGYRE